MPNSSLLPMKHCANCFLIIVSIYINGTGSNESIGQVVDLLARSPQPVQASPSSSSQSLLLQRAKSLLASGKEKDRVKAAKQLIELQSQAACDVLLSALDRETDHKVLQQSIHELYKLKDPSDRVLIFLLTVLDHSFEKVASEANHVLESLVARNIPELNEKFVDCALHSSPDIQKNALHLLNDITLSESNADSLLQATAPNSPTAAIDLLKLLSPFPQQCLSYLKSHPQLLKSMDTPTEGNNHVLRYLVSNDSDDYTNLRNFLLASDQLPAMLMVELSDERFIQVIQERMKTATPHRRRFLAACSRTLGAPRGQVVQISKNGTVGFKQPDVDSIRTRIGEGLGMPAHGLAHILFTGSIKMNDGSQPKSLRFYRVVYRISADDKVEMTKIEQKNFKWNPDEGRFYILCTLNAVYSIGKGQIVTEPYAIAPMEGVLIAEGAEPLRITMYAEMPDLEITLSKP